MRIIVVLTVMAVASVSLTEAKEADQGSQERCRGRRKCGDCIQTEGCAWCINPLKDKPCQHAASINLTSFCSERDLQNPQNDISVVWDEELTGVLQKAEEKTKQTKEIIQLKPQRIKLSIRKDAPERLQIKYRRARDYPVDLYFLMDMSASMEDDKNNLANLTVALIDTMTELTTQFTLGFGSFVDKDLMPFADTSSLYKDRNKPRPYSFRNVMKLSSDHHQFKSKVEETRTATNLDHPEGGFDGLMQAMVCQDKIGWRNNSRRIIVFATDAKFHHAGDGRLAGVVKPSDEQCHMDENGEYKDFDKYDYPSIGQINKVANEMKINIIFAVLEHVQLYEALAGTLKTATAGKLEDDSLNVVELIKDQYSKISSGVVLNDNSTNDINIKYFSTCKGSEKVETNRCDKITEQDEVTFELEVTAKTCLENGKRSIVAVRTLEDEVILDIEFVCSCNCPKTPTGSACLNNGQLVCGVCECRKGFDGDKCECGSEDDSYNLSDDQDQQSKCVAPGSEKPCSGRGICNCGRCKCPEQMTGDYCECNKLSCQGTNAIECSGHGRCACNKCVCDNGYSGKYCECDNNACIPPGSSRECSGHGHCDCDRCICDQKNVTYTGRYCEDCLSCGSGKCDKLKDCVKCVHFGIGPRKHNCNTCQRSTAVDVLDDYMHEESRLCTFEDEDECYLNFTYRYLKDSNKDEVFVQSTRQCRKPAPVIPIVLGLIGAIVGIGIITLFLWKVFTTIHDEREYAKFKKETDALQFQADENPLYVSATTTVKNPLCNIDD